MFVRHLIKHSTLHTRRHSHLIAKSFSTKTKMASSSNIRYLTQQESIDFDVELMDPKGIGYTTNQLMELAGLACAQSIAEVYDKQKYSRVYVICGPGNNGGDGLVLSRHLKFFGYNPTIFYPKRTESDWYKLLVAQAEHCGISFVNSYDVTNADLIVDAIFGFSFKPPIREPFGTILKQLSETKIPIVSVDIPSGWHVQNGPPDENVDKVAPIQPEMLISLTAPKVCAKFFKGKHHFLGGRFVPDKLAAKYGLDKGLPKYVGSSQIIRLD